MQEQTEPPTHHEAGLWGQYFERAPFGLVLVRVIRRDDGRVDDFEWLALNPAAAGALSLAPGELVGERVRGAQPRRIDRRIFRNLLRAAQKGKVVEFEQPVPTGGTEAAGAPHSALPPERDDVAWYAVTVVPLAEDHLVVQFRSIAYYKNVLREAVDLANRDDLTGLANRRHLKARFWVLRRRAVPMTVLYFDLNGFKAVNDTYGHEVGDRVLTIIGHRLRDNVRPDEIVARLGGDEFAVLLAGSDAEAAERVTQRLRAVLEEPIGLPQGVVQLSASIGAATSPGDADSFEALLSQADQRMYREKRNRLIAR